MYTRQTPFPLSPQTYPVNCQEAPPGQQEASNSQGCSDLLTGQPHGREGLPKKRIGGSTGFRKFRVWGPRALGGGGFLGSGPLSRIPALLPKP